MRFILASLVPVSIFALACGDFGQGDYNAYRLASAEASQSDDCFINDPSTDHSSNLRAGATVLVYNAPEEAGEDALYLDLGGSVLPGSVNDDGTYTFEGETKDVQDVGGTEILDSDKDGIPDQQDPMIDADGDGLNDDVNDINPDPEVDTDGDGDDDRFQDDLVDADNDGEDDRYTYTPSDTKVTQRVTITVDVTFDSDHLYGKSVSTTTRTCKGSLCANFDNYKCKSSSDFVGVEVDPESISLPVND